MNKYMKKRLKRNIYKHGNLMIYIGIFAIASIVTIASVVSRTDKVVIQVDALNVRSEASQEAEALGIVDKGEMFQIISQDSEWIEIDYNGNNGFVKTEFVEINK